MVRKACIAIVAGLVCVCSVGVLAQSTAPATQPAPASRPDATTRPSPEVLRLINLMAAPKFQTRAHAQADLVKMGASAKPALKQAANDSSSAEIRARAASAVIEIDENIADAPTYITLHFEKAPVDTVLKDLSRQAGMRVTFASGAGPITLNLDHVTFWSAMQALCTAVHAHPEYTGARADSQITLIPGDAGHWDQEGRFAIIPMQINHDSSIDLINGGANKNDGIIVMAYVDPKFRSASFDGLHVTVAKDEHGVSLIKPETMVPNYFNPGFQQSWCFTLSAPLDLPASFGHTLALLEGTTSVHLPMGSDTLKIPDLIKATGTTTIAGNHKIDVIQCNFAPGGKAITMHLHISKLDSSETLNYPGNLFAEFNTARVVDAQGQQLMGGGGGGGSNTEIDWQGQYSSQGRPIKLPVSLSWTIISRVETVTVPFKFKNLPLPAD